MDMMILSCQLVVQAVWELLCNKVLCFLILESTLLLDGVERRVKGEGKTPSRSYHNSDLMVQEEQKVYVYG